jgi:hypothetical protein
MTQSDGPRTTASEPANLKPIRTVAQSANWWTLEKSEKDKMQPREKEIAQRRVHTQRVCGQKKKRLLCYSLFEKSSVVVIK